MGNGLDSITLQVHLPQEMFDRITAQLEVWPHKSFRKWKELESLIGHLQHTCKVVHQAQSFLQCMTNLLCAISTMSFSLTKAGGTSFSNPGMGVVFFGIHNGSLCPTSKFHLVPLGYCVMVPFFSITGSQVHGLQHKSPLNLIQQTFPYCGGSLQLLGSTVVL